MGMSPTKEVVMNWKKIAFAAATGVALLSAAPAFADPHWGREHGWRPNHYRPHAYYRAPAYYAPGYYYAPARPVVVVPPPYYGYAPPAPVVYGQIPISPDLNVGFRVRF
jgi:hypothetical protein